MRHALLIAGFIASLSLIEFRFQRAMAQDENDAPRNGNVELLVRGPGGKPLAAASVEVEPIERWHHDQRPARVTAQSDATGHIQFKWPVGISQMQVNVRGVGFGITPLTEVPIQGISKPSLPPLVPWSILAGVLPPEARGAGTTLKMRFDNDFDELAVSVDKDGRFREEVQYGNWWLTARDGRKHLARSAGSISLSPGEKRETVTLVPVPADAVQPNSIRMNRPGQGQTIAWVRGTVRDQSGQVVKDATVYAAAIYNDGRRMREQVESAKTDAEGKYEIRGEGGLGSFSASVLAYVGGMPPARGWIQPPDLSEWVDAEKPAPQRPLPPTPTVDLTLGAAVGSLRVTVLSEGKPVADASVMLTLEGVNLRDIWAAGSGKPAEREVYDLVRPVQKTDASGIARFDALLPGTYQAIAASGTENIARLQDSMMRRESPNPFGIAMGIPVRAGQSVSHQLNIYRHFHDAPVRILRHDGKPFVSGDNPIEYAPASGGGGWSTGINLNGDGRGDTRLYSEGMWQISLKYGELPIRWHPADPPYYEAGGIVAASSLLKLSEPATFTARRFEPASVEVELKDAAGRAAQGVIDIAPPAGALVAYGSTDQAGAIRFDGIPNWNYFVRGHLPDHVEVDLGDYESPIPPVEQLQNRLAVIPESIVATANAKLRVVLRAQAMGYVRGVLRAPVGHAAKEYAAFVDGNASRAARQHYRQSTGEFAAGPFPPGKYRLRAILNANRGDEVFAQDVTIEAGKVAEVELKPPAPRAGAVPSGGTTLLGMGGITEQSGGAARLNGRVFLADGKTPALGARVFYFGDRDREPTLEGLADASGRIQSHGVWRSSNRPNADVEPDQPAGTIVVAVLPGFCGATVQTIPVEATKPLEMLLPAPVSLRGKVSVGGAAPQIGVIHVVAAHQGKGRLNNCLSVQTTAGSDGSFELAGLTPGEYEIQATLDELWLSPSVKLNIGQAPLQPVLLAIGAPGAPLVIKLTSSDGQAIRGRKLTLDRPGGPFTRWLWPAQWESDGAGEARIPALEAGNHTIRIKGATEVVREIAIPPLPAERATTITIQVERE